MSAFDKMRQASLDCDTNTLEDDSALLERQKCHRDQRRAMLQEYRKQPRLALPKRRPPARPSTILHNGSSTTSTVYDPSLRSPYFNSVTSMQITEIIYEEQSDEDTPPPPPPDADDDAPPPPPDDDTPASAASHTSYTKKASTFKPPSKRV
jgi:hypothetical protein